MNRFVSREPVDAGWSGDRKYRVTDETGRAFLLRVAPEAALARKQTEFSYVRRAASLGVPMCRPVDVGLCGEGRTSFTNGLTARTRRLCCRACLPLNSTHTVKAPGARCGCCMPSPRPKRRRIGRRASTVRLTVKSRCMPNARYIMRTEGHSWRCVAENRALLHGRPQCFRHGDYHTGNMRIGQDGRLYIIDFDRFDFGDPWEEFNRIVWSAQCAPRFAAGLVNGYFDGDVPLLFWRLLKLYISSNMLGSLPWAVPYGEAEVKTMQRQASEVLTWFTGMRADVPTWFS